MKTIYKYSIKIIEPQELKMPVNAEVIHAGIDPEEVPCIWAIVDPKNDTETVTVIVVGTGAPIPEKARRHVGSIIQGPFVWHVFIS